MKTQSNLLQAKSRNKKIFPSASLDCILPPLNSSINEQTPLSISPPTPNTTIIEASSVSTQNETEKTTPASQKRNRLSSGKIFDKDLCIWCLGPDENIKKEENRSQSFLLA